MDNVDEPNLCPRKEPKAGKQSDLNRRLSEIQSGVLPPKPLSQLITLNYARHCLMSIFRTGDWDALILQSSTVNGAHRTKSFKHA